MLPQEKADELISRMSHPDAAPWVAKEHAIIAVDEIIAYVEQWDKENEMEFNEDGGHVDYWLAVKEALMKRP